MFTGIVEEMGTVTVAERGRLAVRTRTVGATAAAGDSIAVSGVCLTVTDRRPAAAGGDGATELSFDVSPETLRRSTLGDLAPGDRVNLERPVTPATRLGGHIVQGHVDGVGEVEKVAEVGTGREVSFALPVGLARYVVEKGSVCVDGVSLTPTWAGEEGFGAALVPHTLEVTTLGSKGVGDRVNVEVDIVAKYVESLLGGRG